MQSRKTPYKDSQAFSGLYEDAHRIVFRYIYSLRGGPQQVVEDLTSDTFWRAWKARQRFEGNDKAALGWLLQIAKRLVIDEYRRQKVRGFQADIEKVYIPCPDDSPEEQVSQQEQLKVMMQLMAGLKVEQREILTLRYILGWRVKDIGEHLEIAENTVSVSIRRNLQKLREAWPKGSPQG